MREKLISEYQKSQLKNRLECEGKTYIRIPKIPTEKQTGMWGKNVYQNTKNPNWKTDWNVREKLISEYQKSQLKNRLECEGKTSEYQKSQLKNRLECEGKTYIRIPKIPTEKQTGMWGKNLYQNTKNHNWKIIAITRKVLYMKSLDVWLSNKTTLLITGSQECLKQDLDKGMFGVYTMKWEKGWENMVLSTIFLEQFWKIHCYNTMQFYVNCVRMLWLMWVVYIYIYMIIMIYNSSRVTVLLLFTHYIKWIC